jgi:hypothetical protein
LNISLFRWTTTSQGWVNLSLSHLFSLSLPLSVFSLLSLSPILHS